MRIMTSRLVSAIKGESFSLDPEIPASYIVRFFVRKILAGSRGLFRLRAFSPPAFIGARVSLRCKRLIRRSGIVNIDDDCVVDALSVDGISFGKNVSINKRCVIECTGSLKYIGKGLIIGDNVGIGAGCFFGCAGGVHIGNDCIFGNMVTIHSENHVFSLDGRPFRSQGVTRSGIEIEENCWFGAKATILDGARIGRDCVIAAGAVLTAGDYEEGWVYAGVPARKLRPISKTTANERDLDNDNESAVCK